MREIKFRAWNGDTMFSWDEIYIYDGRACLKDEYDHIGIGRENNVMQFTGLWDKNGKEIYEGDILKCDDSNEDHKEFKTEVWFCNGQFLTKYYGFPVYSWCIRKESWCEVIGNIYENPGLVEG